jgi:hypothetical protein
MPRRESRQGQDHIPARAARLKIELHLAPADLQTCWTEDGSAQTGLPS